jgi:hypothetical protein
VHEERPVRMFGTAGRELTSESQQLCAGSGTDVFRRSKDRYSQVLIHCSIAQRVKGNSMQFPYCSSNKRRSDMTLNSRSSRRRYSSSLRNSDPSDLATLNEPSMNGNYGSTTLYAVFCEPSNQFYRTIVSVFDLKDQRPANAFVHLSIR